MGLFDRFRRRRAAPEAVSRDAPAPDEAPPELVAVAVARAGMNVPDDAYLEAVLLADCPEAAALLVPRVGLAQPRWFPTSELLRSGVRAIALALSPVHGAAPERATHRSTKGPDGAPVVIVLLRR